MFLNLFKKKKTIVLILDIGSGSVGAALVRIEKGKPPHVLVTLRESIHFQETLSSARFIANVNHALTQIFKKIQANRKDYSIPTHIFCTFSSPWFLLKVRHIQFVQEAQFEVTKELMNSILDNDIQRLKEELQKTLPLHDIDIFEKRVIQTKLNGYQTQNPYGKKTSTFEMIATISLSSRRAQESIRNTISNFFHTFTLHVSVFPLALFSAIRDMYPYRQDFVTIDVTGETSDISLVNDDMLIATKFFPYGKNFFIREISVGQKTPQEEAETLFGMYLRGELEEKKYMQIKDIVEHSRTEWKMHFRKVLTDLVKQGRLEHMVYLTTDTDIAHFFEMLIKEEYTDFSQRKEIEVEYINAETMARFLSFEGGVLRDPFLSIGALFAKKIITG